MVQTIFMYGSDRGAGPIMRVYPQITMKMETKRPTAERLLSHFDNLDLLIDEKGRRVPATMLETLTTMQKEILSILQLPEKIYDLSFNHD